MTCVVYKRRSCVTVNYMLALVLYTECEKLSYIMGSGNRLQRGAHDQKKKEVIK